MKKLVLLLLLPALLLCCARAEEVTIVHASDLHYMSHSLVTGQELFMEMIAQSDGKMAHYSPEICRAFADEMLSLRPDAVILSGDLTMEGAIESHRELVEILMPLREAGIAVLAIPGNHDAAGIAHAVTPTGARPVIGADAERFAELYRAFGWEDARSRDTVSYSYLYVLTPAVWILLVDVNDNGAPGRVRAETLQWIEEQLRDAQAAGARVIAVSHQNLLAQQRVFTAGVQIDNARELIALYARYGVRLNLSGHMHMQHAAREAGITDIAVESLAVAPCQYGVLRAADGMLTYDTRRLDVAAWARAQGIADENLLHFADYAADFFYRLNVRKLSGRLDGAAADEETKARMLDFAARVNAAYFEGALSPALDGGELALWQAYCPDAFFSGYMRELLEEAGPDMNHLRLE